MGPRKYRYSIVIPAFNEEASLRNTVGRLVDIFEHDTDVEIIIVDNLSTDATGDVARELEARMDFVISVEAHQGQGYGVAVKQGIASARGSHVIFVMADGSEEPADVSEFIRTSRSNPDACIFGSRFIAEAETSNYPCVKLVFNRVGNGLAALAVGSSNRDLTNGFKLFPRKLLTDLAPERSDFSITLELSLGAVLSGAQIITLPSNWKERKSGKSSFSITSLFWPYFSLILVAMKRRWWGNKPLNPGFSAKNQPSKRSR